MDMDMDHSSMNDDAMMDDDHDRMDHNSMEMGGGMKMDDSHDGMAMDHSGHTMNEDDKDHSGHGGHKGHSGHSSDEHGICSDELGYCLKMPMSLHTEVEITFLIEGWTTDSDTYFAGWIATLLLGIIVEGSLFARQYLDKWFKVRAVNASLPSTETEMTSKVAINKVQDSVGVEAAQQEAPNKD